MAFKLHSQLQQDCIILGQSELNLLLLMNDQQYPWFILVPKREDLREIYQLEAQDLAQFWQESNALSIMLKDSFAADKINVAALGNMVPQLHVHHIARFTKDPVWPAPVWGKLPAQPYQEEQIKLLTEKTLLQLSHYFSAE